MAKNLLFSFCDWGFPDSQGLWNNSGSYFDLGLPWPLFHISHHNYTQFLTQQPPKETQHNLRSALAPARSMQPLQSEELCAVRMSSKKLFVPGICLKPCPFPHGWLFLASNFPPFVHNSSDVHLRKVKIELYILEEMPGKEILTPASYIPSQPPAHSFKLPCRRTQVFLGESALCGLVQVQYPRQPWAGAT